MYGYQKSSPVEETRVLVWNDKVSEGIGEMKKCYKVMTSWIQKMHKLFNDLLQWNGKPPRPDSRQECEFTRIIGQEMQVHSSHVLGDALHSGNFRLCPWKGTKDVVFIIRLSRRTCWIWDSMQWGYPLSLSWFWESSSYLCVIEL